MNRWKLTFEYDGTHFSGWQTQPAERTAEGEAEAAFATFFQVPIDIVGQGRTDAGVHARAQTAHADLPEGTSPRKLMHAMKGLLPHDLALQDMAKAASDFHARFHATSRRYSYHIVFRKSPLQRNRVWNCGFQPDQVLLNDLASSLEGAHNFINFCIPPDGTKSTTECVISESRWLTKDEGLVYYIEGNRFLRHMVRRLVGGMIQTAAGRLDAKDFDGLLNGREVRQKAHSAPPHALYLENVMYPMKNCE